MITNIFPEMLIFLVLEIDKFKHLIRLIQNRTTLFGLILLVMLTHPVNAQIAFEEVAINAGVEWLNIKWFGYDSLSISWLDFNGDGLVDLWNSPHGGSYSSSGSRT